MKDLFSIPQAITSGIGNSLFQIKREGQHLLLNIWPEAMLTLNDMAQLFLLVTLQLIQIFLAYCLSSVSIHTLGQLTDNPFPYLS